MNCIISKSLALIVILSSLLISACEERVKMKTGPYMTRIYNNKKLFNNIMDNPQQVETIIATQRAEEAKAAVKAATLSQIDLCDEVTVSGDTVDSVASKTESSTAKSSLAALLGEKKFVVRDLVSAPIEEVDSVEATRPEDAKVASAMATDGTALKKVQDAVPTKVVKIEPRHSRLIAAKIFSRAVFEEMIADDGKEEQPKLEKNEKKLQGYHVRDRAIEISGESGSDRGPIIIQTYCFNLDAGEAIRTYGRDLTIIANKVSINGEINTTPLNRTQKADLSGGNLKIYALALNLGPQHKLITTGGEYNEDIVQKISSGAGLESGDALTEMIRRQYIRSLTVNYDRASFVQSASPDIESFKASLALPEESLGEVIGDLFERNRPLLMTANVGAVYTALFDFAVLQGEEPPVSKGLADRFQAFKDQLNLALPDDRRTIIENYGDIWNRLWRNAIHMGHVNFKKRKGASEFWIFDGIFSVYLTDSYQIEYLASDGEAGVLNGASKGSSTQLVLRKNFQLVSPSGGQAGQVDIAYGTLTGADRLSVHSESGSLSPTVKRNLEDLRQRWTKQLETKSITISLKQIKRPMAYLLIRKKNSDKLTISLSVDFTGEYLRKEEHREISKVEFRLVDEAPTLTGDALSVSTPQKVNPLVQGGGDSVVRALKLNGLSDFAMPMLPKAAAFSKER